MYGICSKCGRGLKDPWSIRAGIGPICIKKLKMLARLDSTKPTANYNIISQDEDKIVIRDIGPWDKFMTVTNAAESVIKELAPILDGRQVYYFDSEGVMDELVVVNGKFSGFKAVESKESMSETYG